VIENNPSKRPHCNAISKALNPTAKTPGRYRCLSYHNVERAYDIGIRLTVVKGSWKVKRGKAGNKMVAGRYTVTIRASKVISNNNL
jgi:hypothetical protein